MKRLALVACVLLGCVFPDAPDPCELDRTGCRSGGGFALDPECMLDGELEVVLGEGYDGFESVGGALDLQNGVQGGQHIFVAVRVKNPALDRYDLLEARFTLTQRFEDADECHEQGLEPECEWVLAERTLVLGDVEPLQVTGEGAVEAYGFLMVLDRRPSRGDEYAVTVRDPCGRTGRAAIELR